MVQFSHSCSMKKQKHLQIIAVSSLIQFLEVLGSAASVTLAFTNHDTCPIFFVHKFIRPPQHSTLDTGRLCVSILLFVVCCRGLICDMNGLSWNLQQLIQASMEVLGLAATHYNRICIKMLESFCHERSCLLNKLIDVQRDRKV